MKMEHIILHLSSVQHLSGMLTDAQNGRLFKAICGLMDGTEPDISDDPVISMAFVYIKDRIMQDVQRYEEKCETNKRNASKRWGREKPTEKDADAQEEYVCTQDRIGTECDRMRPDAKEGVRIDSHMRPDAKEGVRIDSQCLSDTDTDTDTDTDLKYTSCSELPQASAAEPAAAAPPEPPLVLIPTVGRRSGDYGVTRELVDEFSTAYPGIDVLSEIQKARAWCISNPKRQKTMAGMTAFLNSWLSRAQNAAPPSPPMRRGSPPARDAQTHNPSLAEANAAVIARVASRMEALS